MTCKVWCSFICFSVSIYVFSARAAALVPVPKSVRNVALSGTHAAGMQPGVTFRSFGTPVLDASGQAAFRAELAGPGVGPDNHSGIWSEGSGTLALVARAGSAAPGISGPVRFASFDHPGLNAVGQTAFLAELTGTSVDDANKRGIWSEGAGSLSLLARTGDPAPASSAGVVFQDFNAPLINAQGKTAFRALVTGPGIEPFLNEAGIWSDRAGRLEPIVHAGNPAARTNSTTTFSGVSTRAFSSVGQIAFRARVFDDSGSTGGPGIDDIGIWSEGSGTLELLARRGRQAAGAEVGVEYFQLTFPSINASGATAFTGRTIGGSAGDGNGIWSDRSGQVEAVALSGEPAGGLPRGVTYDNLTNPAMHSTGRISFNGTVQGPGVDAINDQAIWLDDAGTARLVARTGDPAPGLPTRENFDRMFFHQLNRPGQMLIGASVEDTNGFNDGLWAEDLTGTLQLIAIEGGELKVAPGDYRAISEISLPTVPSGDEGSRREIINDLGQVVFRAEFTDGSSGIFVSNLVAIPEPTALLLLTLGGAGYLSRRSTTRIGTISIADRRSKHFSSQS